jgi:hypothetical protein
MRKILVSILMFCISAFGFNSAHAQTSLNFQLRNLLGGLSHAPGGYNAPFLFDLALHMTDSSFWVPICNDTSSSDNWWEMYFESVNMQYVTGALPDEETLRQAAMDRITKDTIPIGIFDFEYNQYIPQAFDSLNNGVWFNWTDDTITDNTFRFSSPFALNTTHTPPDYLFSVFAEAPLTFSAKFRNVTFMLDPQFIFFNSSFDRGILSAPAQKMYIDFGDGAGWRLVDPTVTTFFSITYPDKGFYYIKCQVIDDGNHLIRLSQSRFLIENNEIERAPDQWLFSPGIKAGVYFGCHHDSIRKPVIYLEGIDINENRHVPEIYTEMIQEPGMVMLKDFGYDFIVVDWQNSRIDLEQNAQNVIGLIQKLQNTVPGTEPYVVIGESMGGVIARFALTKMETSLYVNGDGSGTNPPHPKSHSTRLFISIDAPHQGAYVPLAAQYAAKYYYEQLPVQMFQDLLWAAKAHTDGMYFVQNVLLSKAVKQLLVEHAYNSNGPMTDRTDFMNDLVALNPASGGYPVHCKKVALCNGLIDSARQVGFHNRILQPGDKYVDGSMSVKEKFLGLFKTELLDRPVYSL